MNQKLLINILIILLLAGGAWFGWSWWQNKDDESAGISVGGFQDTGSAQSEFLQVLERLRHIDLDRSVFNDPRLVEKLTDTSEPLPTRSVGRNNPFAVFGSGDISGRTFDQTGSNTDDSDDDTNTTTEADSPTDFEEDLSLEDLLLSTPDELGLTQAEYDQLLSEFEE